MVLGVVVVMVVRLYVPRDRSERETDRTVISGINYQRMYSNFEGDNILDWTERKQRSRSK